MHDHAPGCGCGRHHTLPADPHAARRPGEVSLTGRLVCRTPVDLMAVLEHAGDHIAASRAEPGCLQFDLVQTEDPMVWSLAERFCDVPAYRAHQARTGSSDWGKATAGIERAGYDRRGIDAD